MCSGVRDLDKVKMNIFNKSRGRMMVDLAKLQVEKAHVDSCKESDVDSSPCRSLSVDLSPFDDSDADPTFDPSGEDIDKICERIFSSTSSSSSNSSELSCVIPPQEPLFFNSAAFDDATHIDTTQREELPNHTTVLQTNVNIVPAKRWKKKRTFCKFCASEVTNFERHLKRNHKDIKEVTEMLGFPKKSKERKHIISLIRNAGHFNEFLKGNIRPIYQHKKGSSGPFYPCVNCKGLYSKTFLFRHSKRCAAVGINTDSRRIKHLSASQTLIASAIQGNNSLLKLRVKKEVFDIMRADEISLVAKTDPLICNFGEQYLKKHKRKQMAVVCSNKMRELARMLIELRHLKNNEKYSLADVVDPIMFDTVLECAKKIGGYDPDSNTYRAPSLSAHIGTSLKQASDILIRLLLKQDPSIKCSNVEKKLREVKRFRDLISTQWTTEISSLAFKDLNEKKWNKPTILPLTKDILKFRDFVTDAAKKAVAELRKFPDNKKQFKCLVDATLILTILYTRKRIGDVQYTMLQTYLNIFSSRDQEECMNSLTESEKMLTKHYKRVVTGGKGSRPIVILFRKNIQELMNFMIELRNSANFVPVKNPYLFAYPDSERWARGDVAIRKFAQKANLKYPKEITSNKLRKQIATVMQILNLNQEETEQFAQFMGHTEKTHNEFYRLPQDLYQMAKVSKLLILMDNGSGNKYKGKSLGEIDINPEVDLPESEESETEEVLVNSTASVSNFISKSPAPDISGNEKSSK